MDSNKLASLKDLIISYDDETLLEALELVSNEVKIRNENQIGSVKLSDEEIFDNFRSLLNELTKIDLNSIKTKAS
jgi:hypothetical protein